MDVKKFQLAMRPKKYLTHDFIVYRNPSMQAARSEMQGFKEGGRVGFKNGGFAEKLENAIFEINKRNELGILSRAEDIAKASGIDKSDINKYIRDGRLPKLITKEEAVKKYINNALDINKPLSAFKNQSILDYLNNTLPEGSKGRLGISDIKKYVKSNYPELYTKLYAKQTGAMDFINKNEKIQNLGVNDYLRDPELIRNQTYIENLSLGAKRDELRILNAKLKLGAKDFAISQAQDRLVDDLNKAIRNDPSIVLDNPKLMELASARVNSKTGELMIGVRDENKIKADIDKGFFSKEHLNPKAGEKINVEFPTNKILVPRTTNESFIRSVQSYTKNNPEATLSDDLLNFINHHGFNIKTEAGQTLGPKIGSTIENGKLGSFARQLEAYGVDTSKFNLSVPDVTKTELTQLKQPIKIRAQELDKIINSQFENNPQVFQLAESAFGDVCRIKKSTGGRVPGEDYNTCIARNLNETIGDATNVSDKAKSGKAISKLSELTNVAKAAKYGKNALRGLQAILIGTGVGEIALTAALEGLGPIEGVVEGEDWRRVVSRAPLINLALNAFGFEDFSEENLKKIVYGSGLEGAELAGAEKLVKQFDRANTLSDLFGKRQRTLDYENLLIDEGTGYVGMTNDKIAEIDKQIEQTSKNFGLPENQIKRDDVLFFKKGLENYVSKSADKIQSSYLGKTGTSGYGAMSEQPYILGDTEFVGDEFFPTKSREQIKAELQQKRTADVLENRAGYGFMDAIIGDIAGPGKADLSLQETFQYDPNAILGYSGGGVVKRKGFADGPKIGRRGFLGMLAAVIASLKVGSFGKTGKKVTSEVAKKVLKDAPAGTPDWFAPLVDKVFREGVDAGETMKTVTGRETVKKLEVPTEGAEGALTDKYYLYENPDTGEIRVDIDIPGAGANDEEFSIFMRPDRVEGINDDGTPMISDGEFFLAEDRATGVQSGPDDWDMELLSTDVSLEDSASDWYRVEKFATGKTDEAARQKKLKYKQDIEADPVQDIVDRQGEYDYSSYKDLDIDE